MRVVNVYCITVNNVSFIECHVYIYTLLQKKLNYQVSNLITD